MRETTFIEQNQRKWQEFEQLLDGTVNDPEKLSELFIQVTDDLSYARTFYPNRSVRVYLNGLAQRIFFNIYKNKRSAKGRLAAFWLDELPRLIHEARNDLRLSLFIFSLAVAIGMLSCWAEPEFLRSILGDRYVDMTEANIKSGDPMAVYKEAGEFNMFLGITLNNIYVAFITFVTGIFYAIGTIGSLLFNGVMLGAFQFFFIEKGLFKESFLAVWLHGSFEISSIVIAGGAGLTMGRGLVFPGTLSRERSFQLAARRGMSLMVGVIPLFIFAGFTESYLTRHTEAPDWLRALFIFICFAMVGFYFVFYPWWRARVAPIKPDDFRLTPDVDRRVDFTPIKTAGDLFTDTFAFFRKNLKPLLLAAFGAACLYCTGAFLLSAVNADELFQYSWGWFGIIGAVPSFFNNPANSWLFPFAATVFAIATFVPLRLLKQWRLRANSDTKQVVDGEQDMPSRMPLARTLLSFAKTWVAVAIFCTIFLLPGWAAVLLMLFLFPIFFLWVQVMIAEDKNPFAAIARAADLMMVQFGQMLGVFLLLLICGALFFFIFDTGLLQHLINIISVNFALTEQGARNFHAVAVTVASISALSLIFSLWVTGAGLQYHSAIEASEAFFLKKRLEIIGLRARIKGLEREG